MEYNGQLCKEKHKNIEDRLVKLEAIYNIIHKLTLEVSKNVTETQHMRKELNDLIPRVKDLEDKPKLKYEKYTEVIIILIIGAVIGTILMQIGLKG